MLSADKEPRPFYEYTVKAAKALGEVMFGVMFVKMLG